MQIVKPLAGARQPPALIDQLARHRPVLLVDDNGRVFALNVTLESSAEITGRVFHNTITVARGARIDARMPWRPPSYFETLDQLPETRE